MYKAAICDDDEQLCGRLEELIHLYGTKNHKTFDTDVFFTGEALLKSLLKPQRYDMIFLDICLSDTTGIEIGSAIREKVENYNIPIIYISTHADYAMQLFKTRPFDFLIKPIQKEVLYPVLDKVCQILDSDKLYFTHTSAHGCLRIAYKDILYFYSNNKMVTIVMAGRTETFRGKLADVALQTGGCFLSIHKSFLVNRDYVEKYSYETVRMVNGDLLNISRNRRNAVREDLALTWEDSDK